MERVVALLVTQKGRVVPSWLLALSPVSARPEPGTVSAHQVDCQPRHHVRPLTHHLSGAVPSLLGVRTHSLPLGSRVGSPALPPTPVVQRAFLLLPLCCLEPSRCSGDRALTPSGGFQGLFCRP